MKKLFTILFFVFLISCISSIENMENIPEMNIQESFVAGDIFYANFSLKNTNVSNKTDSPLLMKVILNYEDDEKISVEKGDFDIKGFVKNCSSNNESCSSKEYFICNEQEPLIINYTQSETQINDIPDGVFYCYNESIDLSFYKKHIFLIINSNPAIYPGKYEMSIMFFYMNNTKNKENLSDEEVKTSYDKGSYSKTIVNTNRSSIKIEDSKTSDTDEGTIKLGVEEPAGEKTEDNPNKDGTENTTNFITGNAIALGDIVIKNKGASIFVLLVLGTGLVFYIKKKYR